MAQITLNIPDAVMQRVLDAVAATQGYDPAGGQNKTQFAKSHLIAYLKEITVGYEVSLSTRQAATSQRATSEQQITIT